MSGVPNFHSPAMGILAEMAAISQSRERKTHNEIRLAAMEPRIAKLERYFNADTPA